MRSKVQKSESYLLCISLAIIGGFLDSYTYLCRGGVFANAQTGNIVLLGINAINGRFMHAFYYLMPILSFVVGVLIVEVIRSKFKYISTLHWRQIVIIDEIVILIAVGFIPIGNLNTLANILVSFTCSLQVETFRKINGKPFATTMCTGNLRSGTENLYKYLSTKDRTMLSNAFEYYTVIVFFIAGAAIGSLLTNHLGKTAVFLAAGAMLIPLIIMFFESHEQSKKEIQK